MTANEQTIERLARVLLEYDQSGHRISPWPHVRARDMAVWLYARGVRVSEESGAPEDRERLAAETVCRFYFEIAAEAIGEDRVRELFRARMNNELNRVAPEPERTPQ